MGATRASRFSTVVINTKRIQASYGNSRKTDENDRQNFSKVMKVLSDESLNIQAVLLEKVTKFVKAM